MNLGEADSPPRFIALVHMVLFVQPFDESNITYFIDASGGGSCPVRPIPLLSGAKVTGASPTEWHSLVKTSRSDSSLG